MNNNKQSSILQLIKEMQRRISIIQSEPQTMARELMIDNLGIDLEQYNLMHEEEVITAWGNGWVNGDINQNRYEYMAQEYYNETFNQNV